MENTYDSYNNQQEKSSDSNTQAFDEFGFTDENPTNSSSEVNTQNTMSSDDGITISSSCTPIPATDVVSTGNEFSDSDLIPASIKSGSFFEVGSLIEFFAYDSQKNLISQDYNFTNYSITNNTATIDVPTTFTNADGINEVVEDTSPIPTNEITLNPTVDLFNRGFDNGEIFAYYNFINYELNSSTEKAYYISEISGDRTEIRLKSNVIPATDVRNGYENLKSRLNGSRDFDEFYLSLYGNINVVGINILLEEDPSSIGDPSILVKLFQPLPQPYKVEDRLYATTKVGESIAYRVEFFPDFESFVDNANYIKGPNINIPLNDLINNSTTLQSYDTLTDTPSSESLGSVLNYLNKTGVTITPNYSYNTFNEFINFSSAKQRVNNFYEKVAQIQSYQSDIDILTTTTSSNPGVIEISQSLASLQTNITNLVENFDGYENFLYYNSSSFAYPKTGSEYPYALFPTSSLEVDTWLGSDVENNQYYGGIILSASLYDENNQNWLYYTIPTFITENSDNNKYIEFSNMVGQSFDEVWLYTRALSERYNTTNDPESGLPLDLAAEAIKGLGFETFGNNYDNQDNFIGLTGEDNGIYVPPTGSELITDYIAINNGKIINYWNLGYSWLNYVEQLNEPGFPYAIDKVSKEIYKRLYHNMAYLTKKKGTISGLRQLINIWGIPNTILRINEFGGKNKDNSDDYDLWYKRYSYAYTPVANQYMASSSVKVPWMPLQRNNIAESEYIVPDGVALRFKTTGHPSSSYGGKFYSQSLAVKKSNGTSDQQMDWGIGLFYEDQPSGSYSGSSYSDYYNYGKLRFYMSASTADGGVQISDDIFLPFFDGGWWSVLLQRDQHVSASNNNTPTTYTLFAANKQVDGWDGNSLGWSGSVSMSSADIAFNTGYGGANYDDVTYDVLGGVQPSINKSWNDFGVTEYDGVYVGGYVSGSNVMTEILNEGAKIFSGSFQEFRYYSNNISKETFNDFVMNPESVEGNKITGSESSFDIVNFRAPLGNELEYKFTSSVSESFSTLISSSHPSITGSAPLVFTQSFINPTDSSLTSSYEFIGYEAASTYTYSKPNVETYFLDQPAIGIRNRISNKIQVDDNSDYGTVLSKYRSIDQNYLISRSYTEDITSLEVGFSPQDEVNDDIIATYGYGVISDVLADPRFAYEGKESYYPKLRDIANDYFKKYTEGDVWDYLRLIKYFDNSLFKAIKSYVPARTSVTTGIIVKQHMLERNRRVPVTVNPNTIIAYTPETGSVVGGQSTATGMNSPISYRDLELTGNINVATIEGSTGGVPNPYNVEATQSAFFQHYSQTSPGNIPGPYINLLGSGGVTSVQKNISKTPSSVTTGIRLAAPLKTRFRFINNLAVNFLSPDTGFEFAVSSSLRGIIGTDIIMSSSLTPVGTVATSSFYEMLPQEDISFWVKGVDVNGNPTSTQMSYLYFELNVFDDFTALNTTPIQFSSSVANSYVSQSYIVRNNTISGSVYGIHKSQDEFYNGEFSGSNIIATTQSLLNNPFAPSNTLDTSYVINVSASSGRYSGTFAAPINTYPSFSLFTDVYVYGASQNPDEITTDVEEYENIILNGLSLSERDSRAAIFIRQSIIDFRNYFIETLFLPVVAAPNPYFSGADPMDLSFEISSLFGIGNVGGKSQLPTVINPIPLPPVSASGMDGGLYAAIGAEPAYQSNNIGPYFRLNFSGSDIFQSGVTVNGGATPVDFAPNGLAGGLDSNILISPLLGSKESIEVSSIDLNGRATIKYNFNNPSLSGQRPIRLNGFLDPNITSSWNNTTQVTMSLYVSNFDAVFNSTVTPTQFDANAGWIIQQTRDNGGNFIGSGSLLVQGTTWSGSFGDSGYWAPYGILLNEKNYDGEGNLNNNSETILNPEVSFNFEITDWVGGNATTIDEYGFFGGEFIQELTTKTGIISQNYTDTTKNSIGFTFDPITSRQLSGMYQGGLSGLYQPTGSQNTQYINFNPQLPPFTSFYNTPFNPLINNVTGSVFNTYKQVIEYDNGPIPSNIIPIISGSALKAQVPDSFYTQKASLLPRFEGSKLQSANYNSFTAGALSDGGLKPTQDILSISNGGALAIGAGGPANLVAISKVTGGAVQTGVGARVKITSNGTAVISLEVSASGKGYVPGNILIITQADLITAGFASAAGDLIITLNSSNILFTRNQIQYLNGELPGTIISGSNQDLFQTISCFAAGTQISLVGGSTKNIEDITIGEKILTYNEDSKENEESIVGDLVNHQLNSSIILEFNNGVAITTTNEHPFYVKSKGWVKALNLEVQDICQNVEGEDVIITSIINKTGFIEVFNLLNVNINHNYYANGILVHNKSTPSIIFIGTSPAYDGDSNPGSMPSLNTEVNTVAKHPIYFAHFKTSKPTNELWGSYTFRIDQLIECPLEDVKGLKAPLNPVVIKVDGSGENVTEVRSTFEVDRKALVAYNQGKVAKSGSVPINYTSLKVGESQIYQGAMEYQTIITNQTTRTVFAQTQSFTTSSWTALNGVEDGATYTVTNPTSSYQLYNNQVINVFSPSASAFSLLTGSNDSSLYLMGSALVMSSSLGISGSGGFGSVQQGPLQTFSGRGLALINSYNQYVSRSIYATGSEFAPGIPNNIKNTGATNKQIQLTADDFFTNPTSYITQDFLQTTDNNEKNCTEFEDFQQPILFQVGDEIRIEYNAIAVGNKLGESLTQTFTITDNGPNYEYENGTAVPDGQGNDLLGLGQMIINTTMQPIIKGRHVYDKLIVSPDPRSLDIKIPEGKIFSYTLRRRIEADDRVVIYQSAPTGSEGSKTLSPSGFIIPNDFSSQQKRNVQTIVNQLSVKNTFRADEDNDTKRSFIE